jgi:hypothetical protein
MGTVEVRERDHQLPGGVIAIMERQRSHAVDPRESLQRVGFGSHRNLPIESCRAALRAR